MIRIIDIFTAFFRVGALTLGGGLAMLSLLRRELIVKRGWVSEEEFASELAMATSIPGAMVINFSIFCGAKLRGRLGVAAAFLGTVLPSFLIIIVAALFLFPYFKHPVAAAFLRGAAAAVAGLLAHTAFVMCRPMIARTPYLVAALITAGLILVPAINPIFALILVSAAVYLLLTGRNVKAAKDSGGISSINTINDGISAIINNTRCGISDGVSGVNPINNAINNVDDGADTINNGVNDNSGNNNDGGGKI